MSARLIAASCLILANLLNAGLAQEWSIGFSRVEITPDEPVRLSGYSSRDLPHESVADPLHARVMVMTNAREPDESVVLISADSILVTSRFTVELSRWLEQEHGVPRSRLAVCSTHSHTAPHIDGGLENLFRQSSNEQDAAATKRYTQSFMNQLKSAIDVAFDDRQAARLELGDAEATFAINRRVLSNGTWTGFGETPEGPTDHRVRVMLAVDAAGKVLGGAYLYACHCTTLGPEFNRVSGDWAGLSAARLEQLSAGTTFLPIIGCGADQNPSPRGQYEFAQSHSAEIVDAVHKVMESKQRSAVTTFPVARFGYAGLAPEQPTNERLAEMAASERSNESRWAAHMAEIKQQMGRLPESYPMPIHTWDFGDELSWVFLGGEVVVDYQHRIEKELGGQNVWVAAYTDDVFAYVASESMRSEGGYEVDFSMVFYQQPGRWQSGTEALIQRRVKEIQQNIQTEIGPLSATESIDAISVPDGFRVELVAAEPLVQDPINLAFGPDGAVWVVEMADYPLGNEGGGRIKRLFDTDADGSLDHADLFLEGLNYPTSVFPWKKGVLVIAAPDIFYAEDTDGDGHADVRETWLTGIHEANPQHRASGFELGLEGWLHFGSGHGTKTLTDPRSGQSWQIDSHDVAWHPATGQVRKLAGETQFIRARDAFGNWFGNSNSYPFFQFVIAQKYLNSSLPGGIENHLLNPPIAPPVYPRSQTQDRFNDLFAFNRFTSACSSIVVRVPGFAQGDDRVGLICEPVHNLVARIRINQQGSVFKAVRHPDDQQYDFFASADPWSRPVRAINAPDGSVWIVDMTRKVIEHPEWIPTAWQERVDVRGGAQHGRIYRVASSTYNLNTVTVVAAEPGAVLEALQSENGAVRDLALLRLVWNDDWQIGGDIANIATESTQASVRVAALAALEAKRWLSTKSLQEGLRDSSPEVVRFAISLLERHPLTAELKEAFRQIPARNLGSQVDLQWLLTLSLLDNMTAEDAVALLVDRHPSDEWIQKSVLLQTNPAHVVAALKSLLERLTESRESAADAQPQIAAIERLWLRAPAEFRAQYLTPRLRAYESTDAPRFSTTDILALRLLTQEGAKLQTQASSYIKAANRRLADASTPLEERLQLSMVVGSNINSEEEDVRLLTGLLKERNRPELQNAVLRHARGLSDEGVGDVIMASWDQLAPNQRTVACSTLLGKHAWTTKLVAALEAGSVQPADLDPGSIQQLRSYRDRSLRTRCLAVFGKPTVRSEVVAEYLQRMPTPTPPVDLTGQKLFEQHCAACHSNREGRTAIGPPLENLKHWTLHQWLTAIMDPNQNLEPKYARSSILTEDDEVVSGLVLSSGDTVEVALNDGTIRKISAGEIREQQATQASLMPEGFETKVSPEQISALLGYLRNK